MERSPIIFGRDAVMMNPRGKVVQTGI